MRGKLWFLGGVAAGFVLGARACRETYDGITRTARKVKDSPTLQEAAGVVQEQANRLFVQSKERVSDLMARCGEHFGGHNGATGSEAAPGGEAPAATGVAEPGETAGTAETTTLDTVTGPAAVPDLEATSESGAPGPGTS